MLVEKHSEIHFKWGWKMHFENCCLCLIVNNFFNYWRFQTDILKQNSPCLWHLQETGIKTIPIEKKCRKAKWLPGEALHIAVKRREAKSKGEKESYKHLNAEPQRIAKRDKKAFFSDQCKEIEENNRMGKTRDLLKKIRDTKGTFLIYSHSKLFHIFWHLIYG